MRRKVQICMIAFLVGLGLTSILRGQATSSAISGVVRDASRAVIAGAEVTATNVDTGISRTTYSNSTGFYRVGELVPGTYEVTVQMPGFSRETHPNISLEVGREQTVNMTMQVGAVEQEVVVTGEAPIVETSVSSVSTNVSQEQLRELPLNGRAFTDLVTLNPGAVTPHIAQGRGANYGFANQLSVAGARTDANSFRIDGTDVMDTRNMNPGSAAGVQLGVDTIREFQVVTTNGKAEYGRNAGAIVNAVSRTGTNDLHGSLFEFLRNNNLDSPQFEDVGGVVPPFKRNQFGGTFGGPIVRDRSFFFLGYEGLRQRLNQTAVWTVPTLSGRQGDVDGDGVAEVQVDSRIVPYLNLYPLPNAGLDTFVADESVPTSENFGSARMDFNFSGNSFLFGRYTISKAESSSLSTLLSNQDSYTDRQFLTVQEDHIISPTLLNTFRFGYNRTIGYSAPAQVEGADNLGFAPGVPMGQISAGPDASSLGPNGIGIVDDKQDAFQFEDNLTYTAGAHTMKFGTMFEHFKWDTDNPAFWQGSFSFPNLTQMLTLQTVDPTFRLPESRTRRDLRTWLMAFFAQDDYRVTPNLTLNLGFRWEFTTGMNEANGDVSYLAKGPLVSFYDANDPFSETDDVILGDLFKNHIKNFEPRFGFNYAMGSDHETSLSGGFGIYHNQLLHNSFVSFRDQLPLNFRANTTGLNANAAFPDIEAVVRTSGQLFDATRHFDYENFKTPTLYRYNLTVQRQLPGELALKVGYVGSFGRHMARRQQLNVWPDPVMLDGSLYFQPSPVPQKINPNFGRIEWMSSDVNSVYSSLVVSLQRRFSRGLTFQANYTWSKSIDDYSQSETNFSGEANANPQYGPDRTLDRALSSFNVPNVFVFNGIYELPFGSGRQFMNTGGVANAIFGGWQIGGVVTLQQGLPFTIGSNMSDRGAGYAFRADRPSLAPGVDIGSIVTGDTPDTFEERNDVKYFDVTAFVKPDRGRVGNAARNLLIGPDLRNVNFTLSKYFEITEQTRLQFRSEFFNLFNRHNFRNPAARVFSSRGGGVVSSAGRIDETLDNSARQIQFGLKLTF
jgi:Carboxypeptidase regulatory-like domain